MLLICSVRRVSGRNEVPTSSSAVYIHTKLPSNDIKVISTVDAIHSFKKVTDYKTDYRANGYKTALHSTKQLARKLDVGIIFI